MRAVNLCLVRAILLFGLALNVLKAANTCNRGCPKSDNGILKYQPGNVYEYNFDSILTVGLGPGGSTESDNISLKLLGSAKVFAEGNCGYTLQLSTVKVSTTNEIIEKKIVQSIQKSVHFTLVNGKLEPQLCSDPNDNKYSLNIKRAIISLLQSSTEDDTEVDVFGQCPTHTSVSKVGGAQVISKTRDLNLCSHRESTRNGLVHGVVNHAAGIKSTHLLKASYAKESKISNGVVENVYLVEEYSFGAAEKGIESVRSKVITNLKGKSSSGVPAAAPHTGARATSVIFDKPDSYAAKNLPALKLALTQLVDLLDGYVKKNSAESFSDLIRLFRNADSETLLELAAVPHPNIVLARNVYLDALFHTGTSESAKAILKQFNKLSERDKLLAINSLNFVESIDKDTLNHAATLLTPNAPKQLYLSIGTLVSKYCIANGCEQGDLDGISRKFTDNLKHCKANTKKDEDRIVNVLKGINNMGHLGSDVAGVLAECASSGRSIRIRVAALQAFASGRCDSVLAQKALALLRDHNEDSELRIEAYLAAINCPTSNLANEIAGIVNSEPVYQVGGFIASNLRTIRDSTDDQRAYQRYYLGNIRVTKHFSKDIRRYSHNEEVSYKLNALGISASSDYKLIYSQHGFLPRSAKLNVSAEIFGTNYNVFEISARQENLENILEYYVGPKGLLNKDFHEIIKLIEIGGSPTEADRARRSVAEETSKLSKKYKTYGSKSILDVNLDLSLKFFSSEKTFLSLGDQIPSSLNDIIKEFSSAFGNVKKELLSYNKEFTSHDLFLDVNAIYPTGLGIPLELSTQGFAANKLGFGVNLDVDAVIEQNWLANKYQVKLVPSVDISLKLQLGFNAYVLTTGLQVESSLHSASGADLKFDFINEGNGFNLDVQLPRSKLELIDVEFNPGFYIAELDKPIKIISPKEVKEQKPDSYQMCFNQLNSIGLNLCINTNGVSIGKTNSATNIYSVRRPLSLSVYTEVENKYNLRGSYVPQTNSGSQEWKIELNTPESKESHTASVTFDLGSNPRTYGRLALNTPLYHIALETGFNNDNKELVLYTQYEDNDNVQRNRIGFIRNGNEYRPVIEIQDKNSVNNEINGYRLDGRVILQKTGDKQAKYIFENFQVSNRENELVVVNGWTEVGQASLENELHIDVGKDSYLVKGNYKVDQGVYDIALFTNDERTPNNIYGGSAHVQLAEQVFIAQLVGAAAGWEIIFNDEVQYMISEDSNALLSSKFKHDATIKNQKTVLGQLKLNGLTSGNNKLEVNTELVRGKRVAALEVKYNGNQQAQGDYKVELHGKYNKHFADVIAKSDFNGNRFLIDNTLATSWGTTITFKGELGQRFTAQDIYIDVNGSAQLKKNDKPVQLIVKVIGSPDKTNSELKVSRNNAEFLKYNGELQHPQDKLSAGKINMSVKNAGALKGDFKVAKNGKGEANLVIETHKPDQKYQIDLNSKFQVQAPKYELETTINLNGEKKIFFKTDSHLDKVKFSTQNSAEFLNKKISFDATAAAKGDWRVNGELQGNFVLTCPAGYIIDGNIKRKVTTNPKTGNAHGNLDAQLSETHDGKMRSLAYTAHADKFNFKTKEISQNSQLTFTNFDKKKLELSANVKHLPKDQSKTVEIISSLRGDFVNIPAEVSFMVDEYDSNHAIFRTDLNFGGAYNYNVNGRYNLGGNGGPATFEVQGNVQLPKNSIKSVKFSSSGKLIKPSEESGTYAIEIHVNEQAGDSQFLRLNTVLQGTLQQGAYSIDLETKDMNGPLKLEGNYQHEHKGSINDESASGKQRYSFQFNYNNNYVKTAADLSYVGVYTGRALYTLDSSFEAAKNIEVDIRLQKLEIDGYEVKWQAKKGVDTYSSDSKIYQSQYKKGLDLHITTPIGSPVVIVGIFEFLGEHKSKLSVEIKNLIDLDFSFNSESSFIAVDDFLIQAKWDSVKLNLQNYDLDVRSQGKSAAFNLKNAQGAIFVGSAMYSHKKENSKNIFEGQGQIQYGGKSQKTNFRLINQIYDINIDKEIGFSYTLDGTFGPKKGVSSLKITNKEADVKLSICEEKKQCTNVQVQSIVTPNSQHIVSPQHSLLIVIDLRELGYPYEFEFQSKTIRQGLKLQFSLESQIVSNNNLKYKFVANITPSNSHIEIKLPHRQLLLEAKQQLPEQGKFYGRYEHSIAFYFDKINKPNDVTRLRAFADVTGSELAAINVISEIKFEHPTIRPLKISGKFEANHEQKIVSSEIILDIFRLPEQQIVGSLHTQNIQQGNGFNITTLESLNSAGLGFNYEFSGHTGLNVDSQIFSAGAVIHSGASDLKAVASIYATKEHSDVSVYVLNQPIFQMAADFNRQKYAVKIDSKLQLFSQAAVELITELQPTQLKLIVKSKDLLDFNTDVKLGKELKFNLQGAGKQLFNGRVALDAGNFLQTTYAGSSDDIASFLNVVETEVKKNTDATVEKIRSKFKHIRESVDKQARLLKDSIPNPSKLVASYEANINQIVNELESDPALKQISENLENIYKKIADIAVNIAKSVAESYKNFYKSIEEFYQKLQNTLMKVVLPAWEDLLVTASKVLGELQVQALNLLTETVQEFWTVLEQYGPALKSYGKSINEALKPLNEAVQELVKVLTEAIDDFVDEIREGLKILPTLNAIQNELTDRLKKLQLVEKALALLNNVFDQLQVLTLTQESSEFLAKLREYAVAKLTNKPVNDEEVLQELTKMLMSALRSTLSNLDINLPIGPASISGNIFASLLGVTSESFDILDKFPSVLSFHFSIFNFILNENWEQIFSAEYLKTWLLFQNFDLHGHIADGHQFFTFDGQHYSFPGSCKYILAQDSVDNNFTVVVQLNNGKLKTIILTDRDGNFAEVTDSGVLKINGDLSEFPQHVNSMHTWRLYYTVWLHSEYGVEIMCTHDLKVCNIKIDGFYTSKTRGLLGNGNAEPYDDFIQIDGTIAEDYVTLGNGYGIGKCASITAQPADAPRSDICTEIFSLESPLTPGYIFENSAPYRTRCDAAVAEVPEKEKESTACTVATAYGSALKLMEIPVSLPARCLKCSGAVGQRELGQEFTIKLPNNKADIVFVVDLNVTPTLLNNLIAPAILEVRDSLKTRGFTDVQIVVIAYNESQLYPALLTSDGGKTNYHGNLANVHLNGPKNFCLHCASEEVADPKVVEIFKIIEEFLSSVAPQSDEKAFRLALNYPFRAGAAKSIVGVRSDSLEFVNLFKLVRAHFTDAATSFNGALLHLIGPVEALSVEGIPKEKLVGFNSRLIATLDGKDAKKRQKLQFENDIGIDFVLNNGGWIFSSQNFDELKPTDQKKTLNQVVNTLADTLFRTEIVSDCECVSVHGLHAQHRCVIKSSSFLSSKKVKSK